jgi:aspartyl-tRNA(Asn)/glutamyl-tRNA(Gln) amidotransferase subunit B
MRSKEDAHDYRYFPDPDLLPLEITPAWIAEVKAAMPELPNAMRARFEADYDLSPYDAATLTTSLEVSTYFSATVSIAGRVNAKLCANWIMGEVAARLNKEGLEINAIPLAPTLLADIVRRIADNTLSHKMAREVFDALWAGEAQDIDAIIAARGLTQITDSAVIEAMIDSVLAANTKSVEEFRAGKDKAFNALVGQVMKAAKGKADPQQVNELLRKKLSV